VDTILFPHSGRNRFNASVSGSAFPVQDYSINRELETTNLNYKDIPEPFRISRPEAVN